jgi:threonine dehydratase
MIDDYLIRILQADVYPVAVETPLEDAPVLSRRIGNRLLLKREDQQATFSFKIRGAYNKMSRLSQAERARGVIAASAGNHAQGVALAARKLGCSALIVMPATTPTIKIDAVRNLGAEIELAGDSYDDALVRALELGRASGRVLVHAYDDPEVIAGQGTVGVEILRQHGGPIHAIFVPVGGGGLAAGIAAYVKRVRPEIRIIGVEPEDAASMQAALAGGAPVRLGTVGLFVDGVSVRQVGAAPFALCRELLGGVVLVDTDAVCAAIKDVFVDTRTILEPAGALSIAGAKAYAREHRLVGETLVAVASGANLNFDRLRYVAEVAELGEQREAILAVTIPERPGTLKAFCKRIGSRNITEFNYRYAHLQNARVFVGLTLAEGEDRSVVVEELRAGGFVAEDLSGDETAKAHVRHMVGGHAPQATDERLYRFEFPERPGALMRFLDAMSHDWNISLFHYRNDGGQYGRVLVGIQVPTSELGELRAFLDRVGYVWHDENANRAYRLFLG